MVTGGRDGVVYELLRPVGVTRCASLQHEFGLVGPCAREIEGEFGGGVEVCGGVEMRGGGGVVAEECCESAERAVGEASRMAILMS